MRNRNEQGERERLGDAISQIRAPSTLVCRARRMCLTYASCVWAARPLQMFVNSSIHLPRRGRRRQRDDDAISQKIQQVKTQRLSKEIKYVRRGKNQKAITCEQKNKNNTKSRVKRAESREKRERSAERGIINIIAD